MQQQAIPVAQAVAVAVPAQVYMGQPQQQVGCPPLPARTRA